PSKGYAPLRPAEFGSRMPPHSIEAEESVLGGILLDNEAFNTALEFLRAEDFYRAEHQAIFSAMMELSDRREPIDVVTLSQQLRQAGQLDESGGMENLARLEVLVPSSANVGYYAKAVKAMGLRRRLIHEASEIISEAFESEGSVEDFLDSAEQRILDVSENRVSQSFARVGDVVQESIK